jgi:hypothetical protein
MTFYEGMLVETMPASTTAAHNTDINLQVPLVSKSLMPSPHQSKPYLTTPKNSKLL